MNQLIGGSSCKLTCVSSDDNFNERLPEECVAQVISFLPHLSMSVQVCKLWLRLANLQFWNIIFASSEEPRQNPSFFSMAAFKLHGYLSSATDSDQEAITNFFRRLRSLKPTAQMQVIRNVIHSMNPKTAALNSFPLDHFLNQLHTHPQCPILSRLRIVEYAKKMGIKILGDCHSHHAPLMDALMPRQVKSFSLVSLPNSNVEQLSVHPENTFKTGEIVAVISNGDSLGASALFYGWVEGKKEPASSLWKIYLQLDDQGNGRHLCLKEAKEIGKLPTGCELPEFCVA